MDAACVRIEAIHVAVGGRDEPIAVEEERDVATMQVVLRPDDFAGVTIERDDVAIEADEDELFDLVDGHDGLRDDPTND